MKRRNTMALGRRTLSNCDTSTFKLVTRKFDVQPLQVFNHLLLSLRRTDLGYDRVDLDVLVNYDGIREIDLGLGTKNERMGRATKVEHPELVTRRDLLSDLNRNRAS